MMKSTVALSFLAGALGSMFTVTAYVHLTNSGPRPNAVDLTPVIAELRTLSEQNAKTQTALQAILDGDVQARQAEKDEIAEALRMRDRMMGLRP
jgi:hypothetical protein